MYFVFTDLQTLLALAHQRSGLVFAGFFCFVFFVYVYAGAVGTGAISPTTKPLPCPQM